MSTIATYKLTFVYVVIRLLLNYYTTCTSVFSNSVIWANVSVQELGLEQVI